MTHDMRAIGQTRDAGFQIGARRTLPIPLAEAWRLLMSREGLQIWLSDSLDMDLAKGAVYRCPRRVATNTKVKQWWSNGDRGNGKRWSKPA
jgi:hypothetical protein